jgi:hypothetical protein
MKYHPRILVAGMAGVAMALSWLAGLAIGRL